MWNITEGDGCRVTMDEAGPNWKGQRQLRIPQLDGDRLVLATNRPCLFDGSLKTARITWRRATPNL
jgi:hypothetical protein